MPAALLLALLALTVSAPTFRALAGAANSPIPHASATSQAVDGTQAKGSERALKEIKRGAQKSAEAVKAAIAQATTTSDKPTLICCKTIIGFGAPNKQGKESSHGAALGPDEVNRRFSAADRQLRDSGVFYRVYEDPEGAVRPWPLSHVPLIINPAEWEGLKAALVQRAALLEKVLADLYGPAHLVRDGHLPAALQQIVGEGFGRR